MKTYWALKLIHGCRVWVQMTTDYAMWASLKHVVGPLVACGVAIAVIPPAHERAPLPPMQPAPPVETVPRPMTATPPSYVWMPYTPPAPELLPPEPAPLPPTAYLLPTPRAVPEPGAVWVLAVGTLMIVKMRIKRITSP